MDNPNCSKECNCKKLHIEEPDAALLSDLYHNDQAFRSLFDQFMQAIEDENIGQVSAGVTPTFMLLPSCQHCGTSQEPAPAILVEIVSLDRRKRHLSLSYVNATPAGAR